MERSWRRARLACLTVLLFATAFACGSEEPIRAELAQTLSKGLEAHAAGRVTEAEQHYRDVLAHDPDNKYAHYNLGLIAHTRGSDGAEAEYREALRIDPDFVPALFNLAILRAAAGSTEEAIDVYRRVIRLQPDHAAAHLNLGFLLRDIGQEDEAAAELAQAIRLDPSLESRVPPSPEPGGPAEP